MSTIERKFNDRAELIDTVQRIFVESLQQALGQQSAVTILLSGGSTPAPLYRQLSSADLDWNRVHVALVDERWVEVDSTASNERLLNENLLIDRAAAAKKLNVTLAMPHCRHPTRYACSEWGRTVIPHRCFQGPRGSARHSIPVNTARVSAPFNRK
jgi:6-phosphogluconolactonase/glucosamine-6-phosphate isomerase/deaminase